MFEIWGDFNSNYHVLFSGGRLFRYTFKEIMQSVCFFALISEIPYLLAMGYFSVMKVIFTFPDFSFFVF